MNNDVVSFMFNNQNRKIRTEHGIDNIINMLLLKYEFINLYYKLLNK